MPLVTLDPKSKEVEFFLAKKMVEIRAQLKQVIHEVSGFPLNDIVVNLAKCTTRDADPIAADFVIHADTCPEDHLEAEANRLYKEMAKVVIGLKLGSMVEIWPKFLPGPWCLIQSGQIIDKVDYPREKPKQT